MLARDVMARARVILQDEDSIRWPLPQLCDNLNDGLLEILRQVPAAFAATTTIPLIAGGRQALPATAYRMLRPLANAVTQQSSREPRKAITITDRAMLEAYQPDWLAERRPRQQVRHVMFDEADPRSFWVYPVNDGTGALTAVVAQKPAKITPSGDANTLASYGAEIPLEDALAGALVDFVAYKAFTNDAQVAGAAQRAQAHYGLFVSALNVALGTDINTSPNRKAGQAGAAPGVANA